MVGAPAGQDRIKSVRHHGDGIAFSFQNRKLRDHGLRLCKLVFSAVRHQHAACPDGGIKHLHQSLLRAAVQPGQSLKPFCTDFIFIYISLFKIAVLPGRHLNLNGSLLMRAVCIQKCALKVDDGPAPPLHDKPRAFGHDRNPCSLKVFLRGILHELRLVLRVNNDRHALLGL